MIKIYDGCAVSNQKGIYTGQALAERRPDIVKDKEDLEILLAGPEHEHYLETFDKVLPYESDTEIIDSNESGNILIYRLVKPEDLTVEELNRLCEPIIPGKPSIYECEYGYCEIRKIGNCFCRAHVSNCGICSIDLVEEFDDWYSEDVRLADYLEHVVKPALREKLEEDFDIYMLPSFYAGYLINGDASSLNDDEQAEIDKWLAGKGNCEGCSEDSWFSYYNDLNKLGADVKEFYFRRVKE